MSKIKVIATFVTTRILIKEVEAETLNEATKIILENNSKDEGITHAELKTSAK